jgi:hypothetical protein
MPDVYPSISDCNATEEESRQKEITWHGLPAREDTARMAVPRWRLTI